jgi:hypothetical protein
MESEEANRKRVQLIMRLMGLEALYPRRNLSIGRVLADPHFPALLRQMNLA